MTAKQEIVTQDEQTPEPASQSDALISVIERAAMNPSVDIDKMERLLQMQERVMARQAKAEYDAAMADLQPKIPIIDERGKIVGNDRKVRNTYARWEDINEAIKPLLAEHGFALSFRIKERDDGKVIVTAILAHEAGHSEETASPPLMADNSGSKNAIQALGSSISYGKRYTASALLNITSRGEDDDGQKGGAKTINADQWQTLRTLLDESGANEDAFLKFYGAPTLDEFPAEKFDAAKAKLEQKAKGASDEHR